MRWVQAAQIRPHRCSFIPFIAGHQAKGFFDSGTDTGLDHVYVSVVAVEQMAAQLGWAPAGDASNLRAKVRELEDRVRQANDEADAVREQLAAVRVLKQAGYVQANPPGRPRKAVAA